jgi:hypothetical protein
LKGSRGIAERRYVQPAKTSNQRREQAQGNGPKDSRTLGFPNTQALLDPVGLLNRFLRDAHGFHENSDFPQIFGYLE